MLCSPVMCKKYFECKALKRDLHIYKCKNHPNPKFHPASKYRAYTTKYS